MTLTGRLAVAIVSMLAVMGSVSTQAQQAPQPVCEGDIVRTGGQFGSGLATFADVMTALDKTGVGLLGERHGVRGHTAAFACLVRALAARDLPPARPRPPSIILEMIAADQQEQLMRYRTLHPEIHEGLGQELRWWESGWPNWSIYASIFEVAWSVRAPILAGDLPRTAKRLERSRIDATFKKNTGSVLASWSQSMMAAHCDLIPRAKADELAETQASRDMAMAAAVNASAASGRAVSLLYAGRAHVRRDRSVPVVLDGMTPPRQSVVIALQETTVAGKPVDRAKLLAETKGQFDFVWFIGEAEAGDACERLRAKGLIAGKAKL
jgi:uncharacterized iron-regulated protein